jgi:tRNA(Ile)-lysidine synthase
MIKNRVKNTIDDKKLINSSSNEHIVLGLSGGPDSLCLFHVLLQLQNDLNITIHPVHINHKFRPVAAEDDQSFVEELCADNGLECSTFIYDCNLIAKEQGISGEEAGRNARYEAFYNVGKRIMDENKIGPENIKIAVAQNLNDQAETILMRILRGTGPDGLAGIEYEREGAGGIKIIRPLLDVARKNIDEYCDKNNLHPRIDHTNELPVYTRNKIRLQLIPFIEKNFNPNITGTLNRLSVIAKEDKDFMNTIVNGYMKDDLKLGELRQQHPAIRKRIVIRKLENIGLEQGITRAHIEAADKIIMEGKTGASINLPNGYKIAVERDNIQFTREDLKENLDIDVNQSEMYINWIDGMDIRTRLPGDYIILKGVGGRKKIQDAFVDMKIKRESRDKVLMLCKGNEVLWILGDDITGVSTGFQKSRISENYVIDEETMKRIFVEFNKEL